MAVSSPLMDLSAELVGQVRNKNCIVFVGPDVSTQAGSHLGPPGPSLLALELALKLGGQYEDYSLPWIAQYYVDRYDAVQLHQFVVDRLDSARYNPNPFHLMMVRLPFDQIVYTAQDDLLREAFRRCEVEVNHVLESDEALSQAAERLLVQPYGSILRLDSLKLTEDERRSVFDKRPDLAEFLRVQARRSVSLFLGCAQGDPDFREFYHALRPRVNDLLPRAHIVQAEIGGDDLKYWSRRNATVVQMEPLAFLEKLAMALEVPLPENSSEAPSSFDEQERARRERILLDFSQQLGLGSPVESGAQLQPIASGLGTLRQALSELRKAGTAMDKETPSSQDLDARLVLQEGNIEWAEGNVARAREAFEEAIRRDPGLIDAYVSLHHLLVETGERALAVEVYRQFVERDPTRAFLPPQYRLLSILGPSGVGVSYHCVDTARDLEVVVTILRRALSHQAEALARFEQEVRQLESPRIIRFLELGSFHARSYIVTEYVEARTLEAVLKGEPPAERPLSRIFEIAGQTMEAVLVGEKLGIPHLDLNPENILLAKQGVVLSNYGFSRLAHILHRSGRPTDLQRSDYQAPEQRANELGDQRSDVYALGTILYEMLAGRLPGLGEYRTVSEAHPQAGEALDVLIDHARAYDPAGRFQTVEEMKLELHRISFSTEYRRFGQYTRIALAWLSNLYAALLSRRSGWVTVGLVLGLLVLGASYRQAGNWMVYGTRALGMLAATSLATSALGHYIVREVARVRGLGSLIDSGRGIGASLGLLLTAYLIHTTQWGNSGGLDGMLGGDFLGYLVNCLGVVVLMAGGVLIFFHLAGLFFERRWKHYTLGFYAGFLGVLPLLVLLLLLRPLHYIIKW